MTKIAYIITLLFTAMSVHAQVNDSLFKEKAQKKLQAEFPSFRMVNLEYTQTGKSDFTSELNGEDF